MFTRGLGSPPRLRSMNGFATLFSLACSSGFAAVVSCVAAVASAPGAQGEAEWPTFPGHYVVAGVDVLTMRDAGVLEDRDVTIENGRITAIAPASAKPRADEAKVIDGWGKTLLPGLIDMHVHVNSNEPDEHVLLYLAHGVTTVQSMHGESRILALREALRAGEVLGPRLLSTGPTTATERVNSPDKARRVVAAQARAGYDAIKMYGDGSDSMSPETYHAVIEAAHAHGLRVVGHAPRNLPFRTVLDGGQDSIDHLEEVVYTSRPLLEFVGPLVKYQFGRGGVDAARRAAERIDDDALARAVAEVAEQIDAAGLTITPTLIAFDTIRAHTTDRFAGLARHPLNELMSPLTRRSWRPEANRYRRSWRDRLDLMATILGVELRVQRELVTALHERGVPMCTGTDAPLTFVFPGWSMHRELALLRECGVDALAALRAATSVPAHELGLGDRCGAVEVGMDADLILVDGDPLADPGVMERPAGVFTRGRWLVRDELDAKLAALQQRHATFEAQLAVVDPLLAEEDIAAVRRVLAELDPPSPRLAEYAEWKLNDAGYARINDREYDRAVAIFEGIAAAFPHSSNAWDSLGEGRMWAGDRDGAILGYERSLELDPGNEHGANMLRQLRAEGSWAGWAYAVEGASNRPLRVHVRRDGVALRATVDEPLADRFGMVATVAVGPEGVFVDYQRDEVAQRIALQIEGEHATGSWTRDGAVWCTVDLDRAPRRMFPLHHGRGLCGVFRSADGKRTIQVAPWPWNMSELWLAELESGLCRTLFATRDSRELLLGSILNAPRGPVTTLVAAEPLEAGSAISGFELRTAGGSTTAFARLPLATIPAEFTADDGVTLKGDLVLPAEGEAPYPAAVILGGGGWWTRTDTRLWGERLASLGVAVLCFDKRGRGESGGEITNPFAVIARDGQSAAAWLRAREEIAADQVGVFGFSRGGWHAPLAAAGDEHLAFVISLCGPSVSPNAQETTRRIGRLRSTGALDEDGAAQRARDYLSLYYRYGSTGEGWDEYAAARDAIPEAWLSVLGSIDEPGEVDGSFVRLNGAYDPRPAISALRCPTLVLLGGADDNVTPEENLGPWASALRAAPTQDFTLRVVERMDHMTFLVDADGTRPRVHELAWTASELWKVLDRWLRKHLPAMGG